MDRMYIVAPTRYGERLPDTQDVGRVYTDLDEARKEADDLDADEYDVEYPDHWGVYQLVPVSGEEKKEG